MIDLQLNAFQLITLISKYLLGLILFLLISCEGNHISESRSFQTVDPSELIYKKGDCLAFKIDSINYGAGIVFDFSKDEGGIWYGILLTDYESTQKPTIETVTDQRFLGRKIQSSLDAKGFEIGIDAEYVLDSLLSDNFYSIGNVSLSDKAKLGGRGATTNMEGLIQELNNGKERRLTPPDHYRDHIKKANDFRPDEYFKIKDFLNE